MSEELFTVYNNLTKEIRQLREKAMELAKQYLHEATKSYFEKYEDTVEQIFWHQYTPWFNDGDNCEFSVGDVRVVLRDDDDEDKYSDGSQFDLDIGTYKDALDLWKQFNADPEAYKDKVNAEHGGNYFDNRWLLREHYKPYHLSEQELQNRIVWFTKYPEGFIDDTTKLISFISSIDEDQMKELFDDHTTVTLSIKGVTTEPYDHE